MGRLEPQVSTLYFEINLTFDLEITINLTKIDAIWSFQWNTID
jgi:hypothetical protein